MQVRNIASAVRQWGSTWMDTCSWQKFVWILPVLLALIHVFQEYYAVPSDMWVFYMRHALDIYNGQLYDWVYRGPVFHLLITAAYRVNGVSIESALWVVRLAIIGNVALVYFIGYTCFSVRTGLIASVLVATSAPLYHWSLRHIDPVIAFFMLLAVYWSYLAVSRDSRIWFAASGVALSLAFLTKEVALLFVPLPVGLVIVRRLQGLSPSWRKVGLTYGVAGIVLLPWAGYVYWYAGSLWPLLGHDFSLVVRAFFGGSSVGGGPLLGLVGSLVGDGFVFYRRYLWAEFSLSPLFVLGWFYVAYRTLRRQDASVLLLMSLLFLFPLLLFETRRNFRPGLLLPFFLLTYVAVGLFFGAIISWLVRVADPSGLADYVGPATEVAPRQVLTISVVILLLISSVGLQIWTPPDEDAAVIEGSLVMNALQGEPTRTEYGGVLGNSGTEYAVNWLSKQGAESVLVVPRSAAWDIVYRSKGEMKPTNLFYSNSAYRSRTQNTNSFDPATEHILYLGSYRHGALTEKNRLRMLSQEDALAAIERENVSYVVLTTKGTWVQTYFDRHDQFSVVHENRSVRIYEVADEPLHPIEFKPRVYTGTSAFLTNRKENKPKAYRWYRTKVFEGYYGLNRSQIAAIESGKFEPYFVETDYDPRDD